jgi:preprotein translocase subunit SecA
MSHTISDELWNVFDARRVKAPELRGLDQFCYRFVGWFRNRRPVLRRLMAQARRIDAIEPQIHALSATHFRQEVDAVRDLARVGRLSGDRFERAVALAREAVVRAIGLRPFVVQIAGALALCEGVIAEMATGEGKTLTAAMAASIWAWSGRPVHVITVNDYLVGRDAHEMGPVYELLGHRVGWITHESTPQERFDHYRRNVVYCTSKELLADFLRDQIALGNLRSATQTAVGMMVQPRLGALLVPGLYRSIVDEADSLLKRTTSSLTRRSRP